jgi:hypothetical protein
MGNPTDQMPQEQQKRTAFRIELLDFKAMLAQIILCSQNFKSSILCRKGR